MTKNWTLAVALLSLAVSISCSSAHSPKGIGAFVSVSNKDSISTMYVGQQEQFTANVTGNSNTAVTWSLTQNGTDCTTNPACGTLSSTTANPVTYTAPSTPPNPAVVSVTATSQADNTQSDSLPMSIVHISVQITPYTGTAAIIGNGLKQQFTAVVVPDDAPQAVTWTIPAGSCANGPCGNIDPNTGVYSATGANTGATFQVQAAVPTNLDPSGFNKIPATVVASRLLPNTTYAFRFSGFDIATKLPDAIVGQLAVGSDGKTITGAEDELRNNTTQHRTLTGSFSVGNNNQGTLTLNPQNESAFVYNVVFDNAGDIQMIESDNTNGTGSGVIEPVTASFSKGNGSLKGNFVFGFTGANLAGARAGYAGVATLDGSGNITGGMLDTNVGGSAGSDSSIGGTYTMTTSGVGTLSITSTLGNFSFVLYGVSGQLGASNPLALYAVSSEPQPAVGVSGTVLFQNPNLGATLAASPAVIALTGADNGGSNVSLTVINPDTKGNISGFFDQNDAGTTLSVSSFAYTYTGGQGGRFIVNLLGNPNKSIKPLPFVFYANLANNGFLLDQSSGSVMTGTMTPQLPQTKGFEYAASELPSTFALATTSSATSAVDPVVANALITWVNTGNCTSQCANATWFDENNPSGLAVAGTYTVTTNGNGTVVINSGFPSTQNYVLYMIDMFVFDAKNPTADTSHFMMFQTDSSATNPSLINAQQ